MTDITTHSLEKEAGALLLRQPLGSLRSCHVLLLRRCSWRQQTAITGIYFEALITWDDGRCVYEAEWMFVPNSTSLSVVVDPRKEV